MNLNCMNMKQINRSLLLVLLSILFVPSAVMASTAAGDAIYAEAATGAKGGAGRFTVCLRNSQPVGAYYFDIQLPAGITIDGCQPSSRNSAYSATVNYRESQALYSIAAMRLDEQDALELSGNDGPILTLTFRVADGVVPGDYTVKISGAMYADPSGLSSVRLPDTTSALTITDFMKGDVTGDGKVNGTDIQSIINLIVAEEYKGGADVTGDGKVNGTDIQAVINIIVNEE